MKDQSAWTRYVRFLRPNPDADVEDEIAFHLEMRAKEIAATGVPLDEARHEARRRFGDMARVQAECRRMERARSRSAQRMASLRDLRGDLTFVFRTLVRQPAFTLAAVLTLGLTIGLNTAIFSAVNAFLLKPLPVTDPQDLVVIAAAERGTDLVGNTSYPVFRDVQGLSTVFKDAVTFEGVEVAIRTGNENMRGFALATSGNYFTMLGVRPAMGRLYNEDAARSREPVVVLNDAFWKREFNRDPGIIGRTLTLNEVPFTIIGVLPPEFIGTMPLVAPDLLLSEDAVALFEPRQGEMMEDRKRGANRILARLEDGVTLAQARQALDQLSTELAIRFPDTHRDVRLVTERELRSRPDIMVAGAMRWIAVVFLGLVGLTLLVACANVTNLLLARATTRQGEIALRSALGASAGRVVRLLLTESVVLGLASLVVAAGLAHLAVQWLNGLPVAIDVPVHFGLVVDWRVFGYAAALALAAGVLAGLAPALLSSRTAVSQVLKEGGRGGSAGRRRARMRSSLVVAQVSVSFVLLVCAWLFTTSARNALKVDLGFRSDHQFLAQMDFSLHGYTPARTAVAQRLILDRLRGLPGVEAAALGSQISFSGSYETRKVFVDERPAAAPDGLLTTGTANVTSDFFRVLGARLIAGRDFSDRDDSTATPVAIVNRAAAETLWPGRDPVGQQLRLTSDGPAVQVVGVVDNMKYLFVNESGRPFVYLPLAQHPETMTFTIVRTLGDPSAITPAVRAAVAEVDPGILLYGVRTMQAHLLQGIAFFFVRIAATLATAIGVLGLLQTIVGLYGVLSYAVAQRSREIGIRLALGARRGEVVAGVMREGSLLVGAGLVVGLGLALSLTRVMRGLLVGVSPSDLLAYAGSIVVVVILSTISAWLPANRASRVAPASALRSD
jgi:putative ABC transport system permease protein